MRRRSITNPPDPEQVSRVVGALSLNYSYGRYYSSACNLIRNYVGEGGWVPDRLYRAKREGKNVCCECGRGKCFKFIDNPNSFCHMSACRIWIDSEWQFITQEGGCEIDFTRYIDKKITEAIRG